MLKVELVDDDDSGRVRNLTVEITAPIYCSESLFMLEMFDLEVYSVGDIGGKSEKRAYPLTWSRNDCEPGEVEVQDTMACDQAWEQAHNAALEAYTQLIETGLSDEIASRVLMPFSHKLIVATGSPTSLYAAADCLMQPGSSSEDKFLGAELRRAVWSNSPENRS